MGESVPVVGSVIPLHCVLRICGYVGAEARCGPRASRGMGEECSDASKRAYSVHPRMPSNHWRKVTSDVAQLYALLLVRSTP